MFAEWPTCVEAKGFFIAAEGVLDKDPGDDLLLHGLSHTTIGAAVFHFRVRDGIGWCHSAVVTRERVEGRGSVA